jgi:hypothetical protein
VTAHPTAEWTGQQLREAFPFDQLPRYLLRDRDAIFGDEFREQVRGMGICEVLSAPLTLAESLCRTGDSLTRLHHANCVHQHQPGPPTV